MREFLDKLACLGFAFFCCFVFWLAGGPEQIEG